MHGNKTEYTAPLRHLSYKNRIEGIVQPSQKITK